MSDRWTQVFRLGLLLLIAALIALAVIYRGAFDARALEAWVDSLGAAGPAVFIILYILATVLFLPGSLITLSGGALFGPLWGTVYNLLGATIGATLAFLIARYIAGDWAQRKAGGRLRQLKEGVEAEGWRFVAFVRLMPIFPFNVLNYALGLTRIRLSHYVVASIVTMLPATFAYTYLGYAGREAAAGSEGLIQKSLLALALLGAVAFLPRLIGRLREGPTLSVDELRARLDRGDELLLLDVRSPAEFSGESAHIRGALNIPLASLPQRLDELVPYLESPIAIISHTDKHSREAALLLGEQGFGDVHVIKDGMKAWRQSGYPLE